MASAGAMLFDFGCSWWGYGSYQFSRAGYDVQSYEIAEDRRNYGIAETGRARHIDDPFAIRAGTSTLQQLRLFLLGPCARTRARAFEGH